MSAVDASARVAGVFVDEDERPLYLAVDLAAGDGGAHLAPDRIRASCARRSLVSRLGVERIAGCAANRGLMPILASTISAPPTSTSAWRATRISSQRVRRHRRRPRRSPAQSSRPRSEAASTRSSRDPPLTPPVSVGSQPDQADPASLPPTEWWSIVKRAVARANDEDGLDRAAALTYYGLLAIFPARIAPCRACSACSGVSGRRVARWGDVPPGGADAERPRRHGPARPPDHPRQTRPGARRLAPLARRVLSLGRS